MAGRFGSNLRVASPASVLLDFVDTSTSYGPTILSAVSHSQSCGCLRSKLIVRTVSVSLNWSTLEEEQSQVRVHNLDVVRKRVQYLDVPLSCTRRATAFLYVLSTVLQHETKVLPSLAFFSGVP